MPWSPRIKSVVTAAVALVLLALAVIALRAAVGGDGVARARTALAALPSSRIAVAVLLTACSYLLLTAYDGAALRYAGKPLPRAVSAVTSFIAYAITHNIGFGVLTGTAVRARRYGKHGLGAEDVARVAAFAGVTTWLGIAVVGGVSLVASPPHEGLATGLRGLGAVALVLAAAYLALCAFAPAHDGARTLTLWRFSLTLPRARLALLQIALGTADWLLAGSVLAALVAVDLPTFGAAVGAFAVAAVVALVSHVPGGLGVLEGVVVVLLTPRLPVDAVLGALVAFRAVYYLGPFALALVTFGAVEASETTTGGLAVRALRGVVPELSAVVALLGGVVLLASGARPGIDARLRALHHLVPLPLIEGSHLVGSVAGIGLVILARGLWRRLDAAWVLAITLACTGAVASLLKGFDWEQALVMLIVVALLVPQRDRFYRRGSLLSEPLSGSFLLGVAAIVVGTMALGWLAFENVEYRSELWWRTALDAHAPRILRASVGVVAVLIVYGASQLVRPAKLRKRHASAEDIAAALAIATRSPESAAHLVAMGDKQLLFADDNSAFVMYGVEGRTFIALGDPIGDAKARPALISKFRALADAHGAACAFYQVAPETITDYVDRGFALVKLGEEARVDLLAFALEGRAMKNLRASHKKAAKDVSFAVIDTADVAAVLPQLKRVSDAWIADKSTREKGFSLGSFDEDYLKTGPVAVAKRGDEVVAFANLWTTATKDELAIDLMRFDERAPNGTMDFLFAELMLWGKAQGYRWFTLGMAPMSGLDDGPLSPLWSRAFALIFRHGEALYNFKGLRAYKEKFHPSWRGRYLACSRAVDVPRVLAAAATLTSGGLSGVFTR